MIYRFDGLALDTDKFELLNGNEVVSLEPQVLSVLIHLIENRARVVSRDDLVQAVWNGRFVSDSAISSRIKSARRAIGDDGDRQAAIRTVHGRGFRFIAEVEDGDPTASVAESKQPAAISPGLEGLGSSPPPAPSRSAGFDRRALMVAGAAGVAALAGGVALFRNRIGSNPVPSKVSPLVLQAREAMSQDTREGQFQAIGIFRRVVEILPDYADGWGMLGMAYGVPSHYSERSQALDLRRRGEAAASRALQIDSRNGLGELALGILSPFVGDYFARHEHMRRAVEALPHNDDALTYQAVARQFDGFPAAAVPVYERIAHRPMPPALYNNYIRALWSAGRTEEADRALGDALALYPTHRKLWFTRHDILLFSGRASEVLALLEDRSGWPADIDEDSLPIADGAGARYREPRARTGAERSPVSNWQQHGYRLSKRKRPSACWPRWAGSTMFSRLPRPITSGVVSSFPTTLRLAALSPPSSARPAGCSNPSPGLSATIRGSRRWSGSSALPTIGRGSAWCPIIAGRCLPERLQASRPAPTWTRPGTRPLRPLTHPNETGTRSPYGPNPD